LCSGRPTTNGRTGRVKRTSRYPPRTSRIPAIQGAAAAVGIQESTVAPANAPTAPGTAIRPTTRQSMLPNRQCATPRASAVKTSARWTEAEAEAGVNPMISSSVLEVTP